MFHFTAKHHVFLCTTSVKLLIRVSRVRTPGGALQSTDFAEWTAGLVLSFCVSGNYGEEKSDLTDRRNPGGEIISLPGFYAVKIICSQSAYRWDCQEKKTSPRIRS